ncbi:MAG: peptidoglycan DD-metalloendopeptidase family protein [Hyphomonadaceae bacterium]
MRLASLLIASAALSACAQVQPVAERLLDTSGEQAAAPPEAGEPSHSQRQTARDERLREAQAVREERNDEAPAPIQADEPSQDAAPGAPRIHTARAGETMDSIAAQYGEEVATLEQMNGLNPPYEIREGDVIVLPPRTQMAAPPRPAIESEPLAPVEAPQEVARAVPRRDGALFTRPVDGEIYARYGAQADGRRLDGVEFVAREGAPMRAAGEGTVVYAGQLDAYDHLVLVRHENGYVTAYGYGRRLLVREGDVVRAGQTVAEAGSRGRVLFQVRQGTNAIDPMPLLGE